MSHRWSPHRARSPATPRARRGEMAAGNCSDLPAANLGRVPCGVTGSQTMIECSWGRPLVKSGFKAAAGERTISGRQRGGIDQAPFTGTHNRKWSKLRSIMTFRSKWCILGVALLSLVVVIAWAIILLLGSAT